jgi:hypothetical protein
VRSSTAHGIDVRCESSETGSREQGVHDEGVRPVVVASGQPCLFGDVADDCGPLARGELEVAVHVEIDVGLAHVDSVSTSERDGEVDGSRGRVR